MPRPLSKLPARQSVSIIPQAVSGCRKGNTAPGGLDRTFKTSGCPSASPPSGSTMARIAGSETMVDFAPLPANAPKQHHTCVHPLSHCRARRTTVPAAPAPSMGDPSSNWKSAATTPSRGPGTGAGSNAPALNWDLILRGPPNRQSLLRFRLIDMMTGFD